MSETANWTYVSVATVRPRIGFNNLTQQVSYGPDYEILCDYEVNGMQARADDGAEFVSRHTIYTEDERPQFLDLIRLPGESAFEEVRQRLRWAMAPFGEKDDIRLMT